MRIEIDEETGATKVSLNGQTKFVNLKQLATLLSKYTEKDFGILPSNTRFFSNKGRQIRVGVEVPAHRRNVVLVRGPADRNEITIKDVGFPHAIFFFSINKKDETFYLRDTHLFGLARPLLSVKDRLYKYPTPNIYSDHRICWGDYSSQSYRKHHSSLAELELWIHTFFNSKCNNDLWSTSHFSDKVPWNNLHEHMKNSSIGDLHRLLAYLSGEDFPNSWLKPVDYTFETFTKTLLDEEGA